MWTAYHSHETIASTTQPLQLDDAVEQVENETDVHRQALEEQRMRTLEIAEHDQQSRTLLAQALSKNTQLIQEVVTTQANLLAVMTDLAAIKKQYYQAKLATV
eukprot:TRINITY_DN6132_c0_g2_i1.p1 TRINITY_DN6132_c0_g2~~TRINITY_DN6132_c0_g2_i1.p1  ORF type:complete len:103 (+),score=36.17 TRINITY_DN6132_c0_g2_i1:226-534(+)